MLGPSTRPARLLAPGLWVLAAACSAAPQGAASDAAVAVDAAPAVDAAVSPDAAPAVDAAISPDAARDSRPDGADAAADAEPAGPPADCPTLCARLEACGESLPGCESLCARAPDTAVACGARLVPGRCEGEAVACLAAAAAPECAAICAPAADCETPTAPLDCLRGCLRTLGEAEPLAVRRLEAAARCLSPLADSACAARAACRQGPARLNAPPDAADFCARFTACGLDAAGVCGAYYAALSAENDGLAALDCFSAALGPPCAVEAGDLAAIYVRCLAERLPDPRCDDACQDGAVCGEGDAAECLGICRSRTVEGGDVAARRRATLGCVQASTCAERAACLAASAPEGICAEHCARLAACGASPDAMACAADCLSTFGRARTARHRACVAAAPNADCGAVVACPLPPPGACAAYCQRLRDCGASPDSACEADCDDGLVLDPAFARGEAGCVLAAPACEAPGDPLDVARCLSGDPGALAQGRRCADFCWAAACDVPNPAPDGTPACLAACGAGDLAAAIEAAAPCLDALPEEPICAEVSACGRP